MPRPTSIEIDLAALRHNASQLKRIAAPRQFFAVVKADAYGHGAIECSRALETIADGLVVAILEEAVILREAGVRGRHHCLTGAALPEDLAEFSRLDCGLYLPITGSWHGSIASPKNRSSAHGLKSTLGCIALGLMRVMSLLQRRNCEKLASPMSA